MNARQSSYQLHSRSKSAKNVNSLFRKPLRADAFPQLSSQLWREVKHPTHSTITPPEVKAIRHIWKNDPNRNYIIIDVREEREIEACKLDFNDDKDKDWINVPKDKIAVLCDVDDFNHCVLDLRATSNQNIKKILILCKSGGRSEWVAEHLYSIGLRNVYNIAGGTIAWQMQRQLIYQQFQNRFRNIFAYHSLSSKLTDEAMAKTMSQEVQSESET